MAALPYMQLYVADYLADTAHLTTEEHGAYLLLLFSYWQTGKPLRADRLASVARLSNERWADVEQTLKEFFHVSKGIWTHFRVEADLEKVDSKSKKNSEAGKLSAKAKALAKQALEDIKSTNVEANVEQTYQRNVNHARSGDTDTDTDKKQDQKIMAEAFSVFWKLYPKKVSKADAVKAWGKIKKDLVPTIMLALENHIVCEQWVKDEGKFVPNAATWLNKQKWEDEVKPYVAGRTNTGTNGQSRPSLVDQVRAANAHHLIDEPPAIDPRDRPEFDRLREIDGTVVGVDD